MTNVNTPKWWNDDFKKEYEAHKSGIGFIRWDVSRFEQVAQLLPANCTILDVGCGLGNFARYLKARDPFCSVEGTDFSEYAIDKAGIMSQGIHFFKSDKDGIATDKKYDVVVAQEVIEHTDKPVKLVEEMIKRAKKYVIVTTPVFGTIIPDKIGSPEHVFEFNPDEFKNFLSQFGNYETRLFQTYQIGVIHL